MADFQIEGRNFRNQASYEAGLRDQKRIIKIKQRAESLSLDEKKDLLVRMKNDGFKFETILGEDFIEEFEESLEAFEKSQGKGRKQKGKKENGKNHNGKGSSQKKYSSRFKDNRDVSYLKNVTYKDDKSKNQTKQKRLDDYDKDMQKIILEEMKKNDFRRRMVMIGMVMVAVICFGSFGLHLYIDQKHQTAYEDLVSMKEENESPYYRTEHTVTIHLTDESDVEMLLLPEYEELYEKNPNLIGWVKIDDTNIDYPVMKAEDREYYLTHGFDDSKDNNGCIFMDPDCDVIHRSTNLILYGHHMNSGKMFGNLNRYKEKAYYEKHKFIQFDTIYEKGTYEIIYAFNSKVFYEDEIVFKYYQFIDAVSEEAFYSNCEEMANMSYYDTGIVPKYGDELLTLSTCDKSEDSQGRFVVVARKYQ